MKSLEIHAIIYILKSLNYPITTWSLIHVLWSDVCSICGERCFQGKKDEDSVKFIPKYNFVHVSGNGQRKATKNLTY